ncbi:hypothetical protein ACWDLL_31495 [Streptomyces griseoincarnatus]|nr:hypothetical protein [Actinospica acidiphila]
MRRRRAALPVLLSAVLPAAPARAGDYTPDPVVAELTRAASALASGEPMDTLGICGRWAGPSTVP